MFESLKVLELASVLAGPAVGQFFAELGATVIKVENLTTRGDVTRTWKSPGEATDDRSAYFTALNWGKKSMLIDLRHDQGREIVRRLAQQCDVVIASYKSGDDVKLGMDYESLSRQNPKLIYGRITGYGPDDMRVGYDAVLQAETGFMFMNGEPGGNSLKMPVALIDVLAAHHLKEGLLLALIKRGQTGNGSLVEVSLFDAAVSSLANQATNWLVGGRIPQKQGSAHPNIAPYGDVFRSVCGDEIMLAVGTDRQFQQVCAILGLPALAADPRFVNNGRRVENRPALRDLLTPAIAVRTTNALIQAFQAAKIPAAVIQNLAQVFAMPEAKRLLFEQDGLRAVRSYVGPRFGDEPPHFTPPPVAGQHSAEILSTMLDFSDQTVAALIQKGIIG